MSSNEFGVKVSVVAKTDGDAVTKFKNSAQSLSNKLKGKEAVELPQIKVKNTKEAIYQLRNSINSLLSQMKGEEAPSIEQITLKKLNAENALRSFKKELSTIFNGFGASGYRIKFDANGGAFEAIKEGSESLEILRNKLNQVKTILSDTKTAPLFDSMQEEALVVYEDLFKRINEAKREGYTLDGKGREILASLVAETNNYYNEILGVVNAEAVKSQEISKQEAQLKALRGTYNQITGSMNVETLSAKEMSDRLKITETGAQQLLAKVEQISTELNSENISYERQVSLLTELKQLFTTVKADTSTTTKSLKEMATAAERYENAFKSTGKYGKAMSKVQGLGFSQSELAETQGRFNGIIGAIEAFKAKLKSANVPIEELDAEFKTIKTDIEGLEVLFSKLNNDFNGAKSFTNAKIGFAGLQANAEAYYTRVNEIVAKNPQMMAQLDAFMSRLRSGTYVDYNPLKQQFRDLQVQIDQAGLSVKSLGDKFKNLMQHRSMMMLLSYASMALYTSVMKAWEAVKNVDSALTQLKIVTGESSGTLSKYFDDAAKSATKLGVSISDIISSTETWARLGYSLNDSLQLSEYSNVLANVANIGIEDATSGMTAILKAYQLDAGDSEKIADILVNVGQKYAVSAGELSTALERGGASLQASNNSLEESVALVAAGNAAVQNAESVGRQACRR